MIIAVTGRIGSGKNTVVELLKKPGVTVLDADKIGHEVLELPEVIAKISEVFPGCLKDGKVGRKLLARQVFPHRIKELNAIVHPIMTKLLKERSTKKTIINAALLDELKLAVVCDKIILVETTQDNVYKRLSSKLYKKQIKKRLRTQKSIMWYRRHADIIIKNNGSLEDLKKEITACQNLI